MRVRRPLKSSLAIILNACVDTKSYKIKIKISNYLKSLKNNEELILKFYLLSVH